MPEPDRFDAWLSAELRRTLDGVTVRPLAAPRYRAAGAGSRRGLRIATGAGAALTAKAATGIAVAAFAIGATGAAVAGTPNPAAWGPSVRELVEQCRGAAAQGIGGCVSAVSQTHGEAVASAAREERPQSPAGGAAPGRPAPRGLPTAAPTKAGDRPEAAPPEAGDRPEAAPKTHPAHRPETAPSPRHTEHGAPEGPRRPAAAPSPPGDAEKGDGH